MPRSNERFLLIGSVTINTGQCLDLVKVLGYSYVFVVIESFGNLNRKKITSRQQDTKEYEYQFTSLELRFSQRD